MSKEADIVRAAEALKAIKALVESNQGEQIPADADILTLDSVVWRSPSTPVVDPVAQNAALSAPSNPEQTIVALANAAKVFDQAPDPQQASITGQAPVLGQGNQPQTIAEQPAHMPSDPYSIFDLGEPVLRDRLETEPVTSRGLPPEQSEVAALRAARHLQHQKIIQERAANGALTPSPHLQATSQQPAPQDNAANDSNFVDFSVDEHEAMMSTPLDRLDQTPPPEPEPAAQAIREPAAQAIREPTPEQIVVKTPIEEIAPAAAIPPASPAKQATKAAAAKAQIPLHIVTDDGVGEGDESAPQDVMRNALRSMIREQIGNWVQDNIGSLIEDALREPAGERKNTPQRNNPNTE